MSPILRPYSIVKNKKEEPVESSQVNSPSDEKVKRGMITGPGHSLNQECEGSLVLGDIETDESLIKEEESFLPSVSSDTFLPSVENVSSSLSEEGVFSFASPIKNNPSPQSAYGVTTEGVSEIALEVLTVPLKNVTDKDIDLLDTSLVPEIIQTPEIVSEEDTTVTKESLPPLSESESEKEKVAVLLEEEVKGETQAEVSLVPSEGQKITPPIVHEETVVTSVQEADKVIPAPVKIEPSIPIAIQVEHSSVDKKEEIISDALHQLLERKIERTEELAKASLENVSNVIVSNTTLPQSQQVSAPLIPQPLVAKEEVSPTPPKISWFDKLFGSAPKTPPQAV